MFFYILENKGSSIKFIQTKKDEVVEENQIKLTEEEFQQYDNIFNYQIIDGKLVLNTEFIALRDKNILKNSLMNLCDKKQDEAQKLVLGYKATPFQIERYKDKYERAKAGEFDEALNALIISNHEQYLTAMRNLVDLIEYFRSAVDDLIIAEQLDKAAEVIAAAESFGADTTLEDIQGLLA